MSSYIESTPPEWRKWYGRIISINMDKCHRFQCGGFMVNMNHPIDIIQETTQMDRVLQGLRSGELIDVTDTHEKGLKIGGIGHSKPTSVNTGKKVYITTDKNGGIAIKTAESPEEIAACESQIKRTGIIAPDSQKYHIEDPREFTGRVPPGQEHLVLHNLEEKVESANQKVFGDLPKVKPGPNKVN